MRRGPWWLLARSPWGGPHPPAAAPSWVDRPIRWAQLTLVEDDPGKFDLAFWLDYFRRTRSDGVCRAPAAASPTTRPRSHSTTAAGALATATRSASWSRAAASSAWSSLARTDPHATYDDVHAAHPDWIAVDADGPAPALGLARDVGHLRPGSVQLRLHDRGSPGDHDALPASTGSSSTAGPAPACATASTAGRTSGPRPGHELPGTDDPQDPARRPYILWHQERLFELWRLWDAEVRKLNPDSCVIPNAGGGATSPLDMKTIGELAPTLFADRQARSGLMPPWANGKSPRNTAPSMGDKPVGGIFSMGVEEAYRWKDSVQCEAEIRIWFADGVANGLRPWFTKFAGVLRDRRWLGVVEDLYRGITGRALPAERGATGPGGRWSTRNKPPGSTAARTPGRRSKTRARVVSGAGRGPDPLRDGPRPAARRRPPGPIQDPDPAEHRRPLGRAVPAAPRVCRPRGRLVATYETSLYDEWGVRRADFGLARFVRGLLTGNAPKGRCGTPTCGSRTIPGRAAASACWTAWTTRRGSSTGPIGWTSHLSVDVRRPPLTLIPSYPDLPMEMVYPRVTEDRTSPRCTCARLAPAGRLFPLGHRPHLLGGPGRRPRDPAPKRRAVGDDEEPPVRVYGPGMLDVTVWRQAASMTVHLVNLTNPMMMKGPFRELIPVGEQRVVVRLPAATTDAGSTCSSRNETFRSSRTARS